MNPLTKVKLINELNEREADLGVRESVSWHTEYRDSAWVFVGGFPYELTEGDVICVFSQYGEIVNINLVRDKKTGKSKGFCFICYEDQRSTVLAVDNFNGIKIKGRTIRVDHVKDYRPPKDTEDMDDITKRLREEGCAPKGRASSSSSSEEDEQYSVPVKKPKKDKKEKKKKKKEKKKKEKERARQSSSSSSPPPRPLRPPAVRVKQEKEDAAYDKYNQRGTPPPGGQQNGQRARDNERLRGEEERRTGTDGDRHRDREGDRHRDGDRRRETDRDYDRKRELDRDTRRETDRDKDGDRRRETDRDRDTRRETDRDGDRRRETDRDRDRRRETDRDSDRRRETDKDRRKDADRSKH
ncbi:RNA-binding motif protein, X-linked 2 [Plectropomus leopardus]|uniref:RNA-binding motif protein, X-linked 2 n=1 Tax=Plectropomus leopardus TaxID=160734 RepID=UPI001C4B7B76|nr:RNA-binding motif protein, X-linked 2 [Plectropomus leopardus]